jgi:hypothetical protein
MPKDDLIPARDEIVGWIESIFERGVRRPGHPADRFAEEWSAARFRELGLRDVRLEPVRMPGWEPRASSLAIEPGSGGGTPLALPCFPLPHSAPTRDLEAELALLPEEGAGEVAGKLAVCELHLLRLPQTFMRERATRSFDPDGALDTLVQVLPFGARFQHVMEPAIEAGAAGFVGILAGVPWETCDYYVPYDGVARPIPGVWLSARSGAQLRERMKAGPLRGRLVVDAVRQEIVCHNVVGWLPGASDEWVIVGSHHDGPWSSAVEDASGMALVLAQAQYWARLPQAERPHNLLFLLNAGHMAGGAGVHGFIAAHRELLGRCVLELHLEHAACECRCQDGALVATEQPEVRWWFTSRIAALEELVERALVAEDLRRSLVLPPDVFGPAPTTDGGPFHLEGVPLVNFLTAPMYLFDSQDTLDKVHQASLVPLTRASVRIIEGLRGKTAAGLRAGVRPA